MHTAVSDRAKRVRHRATYSKARNVLGEDKRRLDARVSAAQDYPACDQADEYAAAVQHRAQRLADAVVSPSTANGNASMHHEFDSYFSMLSFGSAQFANAPAAGISRTPLPAAKLASFYAGSILGTRCRYSPQGGEGDRYNPYAGYETLHNPQRGEGDRYDPQGGERDRAIWCDCASGSAHPSNGFRVMYILPVEITCVSFCSNAPCWHLAAENSFHHHARLIY